MLAPRVAFVDLETTGARPLADRVIEVGIVRVEHGEVVSRWSSLVDPGVPIPSGVVRCTGITDAMVSGAPTFSALADEVARQLDGCLFVAHNARFDFQFLRQEFRRLGRDFRPPVLCTVRLSRALFPGEHRHGLDALIARHGLSCDARHRALPDALVLCDFAKLAATTRPPEELQACVERAMRAPRLPPALDPDSVEALPDAPGAYVLYGEAGAALFVEAAAQLRAQVLSLLSGGKGRRWVQGVCGIEWVEAAGELGAQLRAAEWASRFAPKHGRRRSGSGVPPAWPFPGPVGFGESSWDESLCEVHVFDRWCHLGSARDDADLELLLASRAAAPFDPHLARLLQRLLAKPSPAFRLRRFS